MYQCGTKIDLMKYVWTIFHGPVIFAFAYIFKSIWKMNVMCRIVDQCDTKIDFIIVCRSVTYISWSIDFT